MKRRSSAVRAPRAWVSRDRASPSRESGADLARLAHVTDEDLTRRTIRTVLVLLGACVLFVGLLSVTAVVVTSRAVGAAQGTAAQATDPAPSAKTPLSI
jgi:hypothetical protein